MAFDRLFHDITQKLGAAMTSPEGCSVCDFREVLPNGGGIGLFIRSSGLSGPFFGK
jgi:hypothetical protein